MKAHIQTLMKMTIGQIKKMEEQQKQNNNKMLDIIDRQKETVASYLEQNKVEEKWAEDFLKGMEMDRL